MFPPMSSPSEPVSPPEGVELLPLPPEEEPPEVDEPSDVPAVMFTVKSPPLAAF